MPAPDTATLDGLALIPKPSAEVAITAATGIARDLFGKNGRKPTQAEIVTCMVKADFLPTESKNAASNVPAELKRGRGEHDNKLASDARQKPRLTAAKRPTA